MSEQPFTPNIAADISTAATATRARLDAVLTGVEISFDGWVALAAIWNATAANTGPLASRGALLGALEARFDGEAGRVATVLTELEADGLVRDTGDVPPGLQLTPAGDTTFRRIRDAISRITSDTLAGIPDTDLDTTRRVLRLIAERARVATVA